MTSDSGGLYWLLNQDQPASHARDLTWEALARLGLEAGLVDDGVAKEVIVNTAWLGGAGSTFLGIGIAIVKPDGSVTRFTFGWAWQGLAVLASPVRVPPPALTSRALVR